MKKLLSLFVFTVLLISCAKQTSPTGGPKDITPPKLIKSNPVKNQRSFKDNTITLEFDEFIQLTNAKEEILITPSLKEEYDISVNKKKVTLTFNEKLKDSTTYLINFRESVSDLNEKNPADTLRISFSTGNTIDSLTIEGNAIYLATGTYEKNITIGLYQSDTFDIYKHKPAYITKTDKKGFFKFENLPHAKFYIYGFEDKNKNLIVDSRNEKHGFIINPIKLDKNIKNITIPLFKLDTRTLKITSSRPYENYFNIKFNKSISNYKISSKSDTTRLMSILDKDYTSLQLYVRNKITDSLQINLNLADSALNKIDTIIYVKFRNEKTKPEKLEYSVTTPEIFYASSEISTIIKFNKPLYKINFDSLLIIPDTISLAIPILKVNTQWDSLNNTLSIKQKIDKELFFKSGQTKINKTEKKSNPYKPFHLFIASSSFESIDHQTGKTSITKLNLYKPEETSSLIAKINTKEPQFILQLLTDKFDFVADVTNRTDYIFKNIIPGNYTFRLIIDKNRNGKWDPGNFYTKTEPETIIFYKNIEGKNTFILKPNWELGPLLISY